MCRNHVFVYILHRSGGTWKKRNPVISLLKIQNQAFNKSNGKPMRLFTFTKDSNGIFNMPIAGSINSLAKDTDG